MAAIDDLTWDQLNIALGGSGKIAVVAGEVVIKPGVINADTLDAITDPGVVEFCSKLLEAAVRAQATVNQAQATGERLSAFATPVYGGVSNGYVSVTQSMGVRVSVNPATQSVILGTNS
ncbi:MAG: hypothetical protein H7Z11_15710 [Verrucomicrobia bacterium]|nr:hypothetical protein [Leptolyngbya sp. ES-bin-22]